MKAIRLVLCALALVSLAGSATAVPVYYTFSGTVTEIVGPVEDFAVGDSVTYTFLVDFDQPGTITENGVTTELENGPTWTYFYAEYVGGPTETRPETGSHTHFANFGYEEDDIGLLTPSVTDFYFNFVNVQTTTPVSDWVVGQSVQGFDFYWDVEGDGPQTIVLSQLTLTGAGDTPPAPVPEPGTLLLLGAGLTGFALRRSRRGPS